MNQYLKEIDELAAEIQSGANSGTMALDAIELKAWKIREAIKDYEKQARGAEYAPTVSFPGQGEEHF